MFITVSAQRPLPQHVTHYMSVYPLSSKVDNMRGHGKIGPYERVLAVHARSTRLYDAGDELNVAIHLFCTVINRI